MGLGSSDCLALLISFNDNNIDRKKRKGKRVEDYSRDRAA